MINEQSDFRKSFTFVATVASLRVIYIELIDPSRPPWYSIVVCMLLVLHHNLFGADLCIKKKHKAYMTDYDNEYNFVCKLQQ